MGVAVSNGSVYITGSYKYTADFNTPSSGLTNYLVSSGSDDIFVAKYSADTGSLQWIRQAGGSGTDLGCSIAVLGKSVYVTGGFSGMVNFNTPSAWGSNELTSAGLQDIFVCKFDDAGKVQWVKRAGGTAFFDVGNSIAVSENGVYVAGAIDGTANFNTPSATGSNEIVSAGLVDIFLAKYNFSGGLEWAKRAGGTADDKAYAVAVSGNSVYVSGFIYNTANFNNPSAAGSNEITSKAGSDVFVAQYDDTGAFQWARRAGGTGYDYTYGMAASSKGVYLTGVVAGTPDFNTPTSTVGNQLSTYPTLDNYDAFVAKYDNLGTFQWAKRAGGAGYDKGTGIAMNSSTLWISGIYSFTANFNNPSSSTSNVITSAGNDDVFLAQYRLSEAELGFRQNLPFFGNGSTNSIGNVNVGYSMSATMTIVNKGLANLQIGTMQINGPDGASFVTITDVNTKTFLVPNDRSIFSLQFLGSSQEGIKTAFITINSNDPSANPYTVILTVRVVAPRIAVEGGLPFVTTFVGGTAGNVNGIGTNARINQAAGAVTVGNTLYFVDYGNHSVGSRKRFDRLFRRSRLGGGLQLSYGYGVLSK
jgi:hypothetical protein